MSEDLPPLMEQYGERLHILPIDITQELGRTLFFAAVNQFQVPSSRWGVPMLIVGDKVLVGEYEIPERFPGLIESYLAQGGVDWPAIPGLLEALAAAEGTSPAMQTSTTPTTPPAAVVTPSPVLQQQTATTTSAPGEAVLPSIASAAGTPNMQEIFERDLVGNTLSLVVLAGILLTVVVWLPAIWRPTFNPPSAWKIWAIPLLTLAGIGVAGYLAFVENTQSTVFCGPVGDCNAVQQSIYAHLFGVIPVGWLGLAGYAAMLAAWAISRFGRRISRPAAIALLGMAFFGVLFSLYLTYLEPFVIGATCMWCLASAVVATGLFVLAIPYYWSKQG